MAKEYKTVDLRKMPVEELSAKTKQINEEIFKLKVQQGMGSVKDIHAVVSKRRSLARVYTVMAEKQRGVR